MTRITLSELKNAARNPSDRRDLAASGPSFPTPIPIAASAVRRLHRDGAGVAREALHRTFDQSAYWGPTGRPSHSGWANSVRTSFDTYIHLVSHDLRPVLDTPITTEVTMGSNSVGVTIDVVLLDSEGYVGRHVLWDVPPLTRDDAELIAGPIVRALQQELGENRVIGAEVWHLRSGDQQFVATAIALGRLPDAASIVATYVS